jgi:hypothetical protein
MSSMMPAGRTLWEVNVVYDNGRKVARKKLLITTEEKEITDGLAATKEFLALKAVTYPHPKIKSISYKGVIHA